MQHFQLRKSVPFIVLWVAMIAFQGCAQVEVKPVKTGDELGVRYWEPYPYLLVSEAPPPKPVPVPPGGQPPPPPPPVKSFEIVYLPNVCAQRVISISPGFGRAEMKPELTNGWMLTAMHGEADSQTAEILKGIGSFVPSLVGKFVPTRTPNGFYPLIFNGEGILEGFGSRVDIQPGTKTNVKCGEKSQGN